MADRVLADPAADHAEDLTREIDLHSALSKNRVTPTELDHETDAELRASLCVED